MKDTRKKEIQNFSGGMQILNITKYETIQKVENPFIHYNSYSKSNAHDNFSETVITI
jgi:hypothetical protein